jgi:hypothetical protein
MTSDIEFRRYGLWMQSIERCFMGAELIARE